MPTGWLLLKSIQVMSFLNLLMYFVKSWFFFLWALYLHSLLQCPLAAFSSCTVCKHKANGALFGFLPHRCWLGLLLSLICDNMHKSLPCPASIVVSLLVRIIWIFSLWAMVGKYCFLSGPFCLFCYFPSFPVLELRGMNS